MWSKTKYLFIGLSQILLVFACGSTKDKDPQYLFKASLLVKENHTWHKAFVYFGSLIEERSGGRM